ncbi:hypothetical protein SeMB42_g03236 [Synchytrium endobioticum]|uniref:Protein kinase domain-containing protein n=1 Tax=Synchytrium endobioticum TaxID=286115 RepID=A0A507D7U8_9FUNG|nr:hypothetical protein SeLEV6574_g08085 [Synchytrium endobioticum]TPX47669.1 hypothetical protein SeMB42_g03236 [Synchytrium endobioticum]
MADDGLKRSKWAIDDDNDDNDASSRKKAKKQKKDRHRAVPEQRPASNEATTNNDGLPIDSARSPIPPTAPPPAMATEQEVAPTLNDQTPRAEPPFADDYGDLQSFEPPLNWMRVHIETISDDVDTTQQPNHDSASPGTPVYCRDESLGADYRSPDASPLDDSLDQGAPPVAISNTANEATPPPTSLPNHHPPTHLTNKAPAGPLIAGCRSVDAYEKLNRIEEGAYGVVYRARDKGTGEIVALKKLKLDKEKMGFPVTSLREIHTLLLSKHPNIVDVKEIVVSNNLQNIFIVMEFVEHDLKSLMESMRQPFLQSEIKTLMQQILSAAACLHSNWIVHRDLKTSNLLMNNRGMIKVADFGLARRYGDPLGNMTQLVVTLWYRAPELLLGAKQYTTAIDMWSIGCIFGEIVNKEPLFPGKGDIDQLTKIFKMLGTPTTEIWPTLNDLPVTKTIILPNHRYSQLRSRFPYLTESGLDLLSRLLTYDPAKRITAEQALKHPYFLEHPPPKPPELFPTFPSKGAGEKKRKIASPSAPVVGHGLVEDVDEAELRAQLGVSNSFKSTGFRLNF